MPGGDRTGPTGAGPMTGRGAGYCNGFNRPGSFRPGIGRGRRNMNFGAGRQGAQFNQEEFSNNPDKDREIADLKNQLKNIESRLDQLSSE